ncbi:precorrin-3B C(17)-methyltransferase [Desulfotalea psychrophila]|uniref:Probable precorrin-3B C17-methyltransferase (CobJ) n=1 Tax=Desulfotalea psychrophila (strain LSv54 / DSM 12343) TaxID=177439 RepID=Q6ARS2_DESPS|nr:precorrin-3B C(17)-methyltransferase [Desulfotalea psychrophila]CAG34953.1 probable precorrin-3B C17-methyltransferase (CobJ) [Desulfotalea psychrophila LSv54]
MEKYNNGNGPGTLYVIGTGPGARDHIIPAAIEAIERADTIIGYSTYLDLIEELLEGKEVISSSMMKEVDRCRLSLEMAESGKSVALVSGGDAGIYAMAGLVLEMASQNDFQAEIKIIPGIAAVNACAARLGAPLMHDFAAISLSDLLTPWETIVARLEATASTDFVVALYNPKSKRRTAQIAQAREIFLKHRDPANVVGIVTGATRENEVITLTTLDKMLECEIGMQSTVIIGNSKTFVWRDKMITPRGYGEKYQL